VAGRTSGVENADVAGQNAPDDCCRTVRILGLQAESARMEVAGVGIWRHRDADPKYRSRPSPSPVLGSAGGVRATIMRCGAGDECFNQAHNRSFFCATCAAATGLLPGSSARNPDPQAVAWLLQTKPPEPSPKFAVFHDTQSPMRLGLQPRHAQILKLSAINRIRQGGRPDNLQGACRSSPVLAGRASRRNIGRCNPPLLQADDQRRP